MTCGKCKAEFGAGNFCITCGASLAQASEEVQLASEKRDIREDAINQVNRGIGVVKDIATKIVKTFVILVIEPIVAFYKFTLSNKFRSAAAGGLTFVLLGWIITQSLLSSQVGPEQTMERYVAAIKAGNFEAMNDATLFPYSSITPSFVQAGFMKAMVSSTTAALVSSVDGKAQAEIDSGKDKYTIHLASKPRQYFIFSIPEWSVTESAPISSILIATGVDTAQKASFTNTPSEAYAPSVFAAQVNTFNALPGYYSTTSSALGFNKKTDTVTSLFGNTKQPIRVAAETIDLAASVESAAAGKALPAAASCAKSKCSAIGKYDDTDFDLWSQFSNTGYSYTSSRFDYKLLSPTCTAGAFYATSAFRGELHFSCEGTVKAHLYVRDTYYQGYYSDYWYYWDFYDTDTYMLDLSVKVNTDANGKVTLGAVTKG